tara:strand:- start:359 stop:580 length:222 start_codon:yes stop_codon:yes gene_type:complete
MNKNKKSIEKSLLKLETIIKKMESGSITLEESLVSFEQGIKLIDECREELENAEQKVMELTKNHDGSFSTKEK